MSDKCSGCVRGTVRDEAYERDGITEKTLTETCIKKSEL